MTIEQVWFTIIAQVGESTGLLYQALAEAKKGNFDICDEYLKKSEQELAKVHGIQADLLAREASGEEATPFSLLLVHAQDHMMNAMLSQNVYKELIDIYRLKFDEKEGNENGI